MLTYHVAIYVMWNVLRGRQNTKDRISNIINLISMVGCIVVIVMSISLSILLLGDFTNNQMILGNPIVYGTIAIGWISVLVGLGNLGLGWTRTTLEQVLSGSSGCENCGCISGIPIVLGLLIAFLYQVTPVGSPLEYFYLLPLFTTAGMVLLGITFFIYKGKLKSSDYILQISILYIAVGAGSIALYFSGLFPLSAGLIAWLLIASGPIFMLPLIWIFNSQRVVITQQP